jgi:sulfur relay protein TusB/DsrH
MKKTLILVTKPLSLASKNLSCLLFGQGNHVALIQDGVYNRPGDAGDGKTETGNWPDNWSALKDDVSARGVEVGCRLIDYAGLVEAIEEHDKIVTI